MYEGRWSVVFQSVKHLEDSSSRKTDLGLTKKKEMFEKHNINELAPAATVINTVCVKKTD